MPWHESKIKATDGKEIHLYEMKTNEDPKGLIHIIHGMAEHAMRYERVAEFLINNGWNVMAHDNRGHGKTLEKGQPYGHYADRNGWNRAVDDIEDVRKSQALSDIPYFMLGHSGGAMLALSYAETHGDFLKGLVFSALAPDQAPLRIAGGLLAKWQCLFGMTRKPSNFLNGLTFGKFNKRFKPARTAFDWLSRDPIEVDKYITDPLCGGVCTAGFFRDLAYGVGQSWGEPGLRRLPTSLPVLLISGGHDPVVLEEKGALEVSKALNKHLKSVEQIIYPEGRHEVLNDTSRNETVKDILKWLDQTLKPS